MNELTTSDTQLLYDFFALSASVSDSLFEEICKYITKRIYPKGSAILKAGEVETKNNLVIKGVVLQYVYNEDVPITINITPRGLVFNSLKSYLDGSPSTEIHEAITDVEILTFEKKDLEMLAIKHPEFSYLMFKVYENILLDRENRMFLLQYRNPSKRYTLFHETMERANWILEDTPDKYIASYLNMTPQQYSKEKKKHFKQQ